MICKICGNKVNENDAICMMCGSPIDKSAEGVAPQQANNPNVPINNTGNNKLFFIIAAVLFIIIIVLVVLILNNKGDANDDKTSSNSDNRTTSTTEKTTSGEANNDVPTSSTSSTTSTRPSSSTTSTTTAASSDTPTNLEKCVSPIDCLNKIDLTYIQDQAEIVMGSKGKNTYDSEYYKTYEWDFPNEEKVKIAISNGKVSEISLDLNKEKHIMSGVSFARYSELEKKINNKEKINYNQMKSYFGNVEGIQIKKSAYSVEYTWIVGKYQYINAYFSTSTGNCTLVSGLVSKN